MNLGDRTQAQSNIHRPRPQELPNVRVASDVLGRPPYPNSSTRMSTGVQKMMESNKRTQNLFCSNVASLPVPSPKRIAAPAGSPALGNVMDLGSRTTQAQGAASLSQPRSKSEVRVSSVGEGLPSPNSSSLVCPVNTMDWSQETPRVEC
jgi:hypothetical protein